MEKLKFENWKARCSSLGKLMTNLPVPLREATSDDFDRVNILKHIRDTGVNPQTNRPNKWDEVKENELCKLEDIINKREPVDELPTGAVTYLEEVFRDEFWGRKRILENKFLTKGVICEEDALGLISDRDDFYYTKNEKHLTNDFIKGTPDNVQKIIKDTKTSWDLESFDKGDANPIYTWQLKGYMWLSHSYELEELETKTNAELVYCLVNAPINIIEDEKRRIWYAMGQPEETDELYIERVSQIERNMIYDVNEFKKAYPNYDFYSSLQDFTIPAHMRIKTFNIQLEEDDIKNITRRVTMAKNWLLEKEKQTLLEINKNIAPL